MTQIFFGWSGWFSVPQATVRMVINYKKTQKTILRVSPRVPLADHLPAICEKCEFDVESTVLLRDVHSLSALDLSCSLNDYAIREVYARDTKSKSSPLTGQNCQVVQLLIYCLLCRTVGLSCVSSFTESCRYPSLETISRPVPSHSWDFYKFVIFCSCAQCFQAKIKLKRKKKTKAFSANLGRAGKNQSR